jgi:hypothetical protein
VAALRFGEGVALEPAIRELASGEAVPFLPALRYTESGREKRRVWEQVWELQRREDAVDAAVAADPAFAAPREGESRDAFAKRLAAAQKARREAEVGAIPRPPKYASADFQRAEFWRMRGALDVPKERFIAYPHCGREGTTRRCSAGRGGTTCSRPRRWPGGTPRGRSRTAGAASA